MDMRDFIRINTRLVPVTHAPELVLHVSDASVPLWQKTEDELQRVGLEPPFWAFAWAGGQALARHVLDHPALVRGRTVLDVATGSGLVAIAAARAGAARVEANDIDVFAIVATGMNAEANAVSVILRSGDLVGSDEGWEVVLAGDVCYDREMAGRMLPWLAALSRRGALVLIGDPGRSYLPRTGLDALARYRVATTRDLEDADVKDTTVWRFSPSEPVFGLDL
jgi:predicted nicotinamide N-methyase